jgi:1,4-alpha-glucan branching enzyme
LHELDCDPAGFEWIDASDWESSILSFMRKSRNEEAIVVGVFNFTPVPRHNYRVGVPRGGYWREILNSDSENYGGAGFGNLGGMDAQPTPVHGRQHSLNLIVPPLGAVFFKNG